MMGAPTERQPKETDEAWQAWLIFRDMGPERTHQQVAKKLRKSRKMIATWAARWDWKGRIVTWDNEAEERERKAADQAALEKARALADRQEKVQEKAWDIASKLHAKAMEMLAFPLSRQTIHDSKDGKKRTIVVEPMAWKLGDIARLAEVADSLSRLATGMSTSRAEHVGRDGEPLPAGAAMPTLIQVVVTAAKDAEDKHVYRLLPGTEEEKEDAESSVIDI